MIFLELDDLLHVAERTLGVSPQVRDVGLLQSALARPRTSVLGEDAYDSIHTKAAALLHSLARNHGLVDGNERQALAAVLAFYGLNGLRLSLTNDEAYDLVVAVAAGGLDDVDAIAPVLERAARPRR
ncbi:MAG: Fic family protein [Actinomycetales bacterium]|nr:Fic family protein [Actinomycetales bacterium]